MLVAATAASLPLKNKERKKRKPIKKSLKTEGVIENCQEMPNNCTNRETVGQIKTQTNVCYKCVHVFSPYLPFVFLFFILIAAFTTYAFCCCCSPLLSIWIQYYMPLISWHFIISNTYEYACICPVMLGKAVLCCPDICCKIYCICIYVCVHTDCM